MVYSFHLCFWFCIRVASSTCSRKRETSSLHHHLCPNSYANKARGHKNEMNRVFWVATWSLEGRARRAALPKITAATPTVFSLKHSWQIPSLLQMSAGAKLLKKDSGQANRRLSRPGPPTCSSRWNTWVCFAPSGLNKMDTPGQSSPALSKLLLWSYTCRK